MRAVAAVEPGKRYAFIGPVWLLATVRSIGVSKEIYFFIQGEVLLFGFGGQDSRYSERGRMSPGVCIRTVTLLFCRTDLLKVGFRFISRAENKCELSSGKLSGACGTNIVELCYA